MQVGAINNTSFRGYSDSEMIRLERKIEDLTAKLDESNRNNSSNRSQSRPYRTFTSYTIRPPYMMHSPGCPMGRPPVYGAPMYGAPMGGPMGGHGGVPCGPACSAPVGSYAPYGAPPSPMMGGQPPRDVYEPRY